MEVTKTQDLDKKAHREEQVKQAEELLGELPQQLGVAKGLFEGQFVADWIFPYPRIDSALLKETEQVIDKLRAYCDVNLDPSEIDRQADIPRSVIDGLADLGILGMTAPKEVGGQGFTQLAYCKLLEEIGSRCSSTAIFVNAHHSIGMRALLLFGSEQQNQQWLPDMVSGRKLGAFALTEPEAGSDAANVQTTATPSEDGSYFTLNGQKRYITNGSIADVLTVMARTPIEGGEGSAITAFLVTPDTPGFEVTEPRMEKLGIRGTATARLSFTDMKVPRENILGPIGKGLKVALTVLDFGRTTFGACCTGAAKTCLNLALEHASQRRQFGQTLGEFELVQQKIALMAARTYAMEAMTTVTAGLIDRGLEDYMLETAMLKVWSTEKLWTMVNDVFQIYGGAAYFTDRPLERMLRDHRLNQIGEGANEVLMSFIALTGMRGPGMKLKDVADTFKQPLSAVPAIAKFSASWVSSSVQTPQVPVRTDSLRPYGSRIGKMIRRFGKVVQRSLISHREEILERQLVQERISWIAMELLASVCALSRWDQELSEGNRDNDAVARLFMDDSLRQTERWFAALKSNDDAVLLQAAQSVART